MNRKHYVALAALFYGELAIAKSQRSRKVMESVRGIILSTADICAQDNPLFDRGVFYIASGLTEDGAL